MVRYDDEMFGDVELMDTLGDLGYTIRYPTRKNGSRNRAADRRAARPQGGRRTSERGGGGRAKRDLQGRPATVGSRERSDP